MIKSIELTDFRKFNNATFDLDKNLVFIVGNNAVGKTSILEAIYFMSRIKSQRSNNYRDLIKYDCPFCKVKMTTDSGNFEFVISQNSKLYKKNNIEIKKAKDFFGNTPLILFSPDDINLIKGSPSVRRKFLDMELSLLNKKYLETLGKTNFYLRERNTLLQSDKFDDTMYQIYTKNLCEEEIKIIKSRVKFLNLVNEKINIIHQSIAFGEKIELVYKNTLNLSEPYKSYQNVYIEEKKYKSTCIGYHRDDFKIYLNGIDASRFASEGQMRNIVVSLKIALVLVYEEYLNVSPVLLLDDLFSYLDTNRQQNIIEFLKTRPQTIITTTSLDNFNSLKDAAYIIKL